MLPYDKQIQDTLQTARKCWATLWYTVNATLGDFANLLHITEKFPAFLSQNSIESITVCFVELRDYLRGFSRQ